jgi:hypothetical protein
MAFGHNLHAVHLTAPAESRGADQVSPPVCHVLT